MVLDWAMKYLPRSYREDQSNLLAKTVLNLHVGVAFGKVESTLESPTYIHIFRNQVSQDSKPTKGIILDIIEDEVEIPCYN